MADLSHSTLPPFAIALWLTAAGLAFVCSGYHLFQLTQLIAYAVSIAGLVVLTGHGGQISLGHGAFHAVGAYVTAIMTLDFAVPYWGAPPLAALICAGLGGLLGFPALRLSGPYLALTSYALAVATPQLLKQDALRSWTGGVAGLALDKPAVPGWLGGLLDQDQFLYLFALAVAAPLFWAAANLLRGRIGRALRAVRGNATAAAAMGVRVARIRTGAFAMSALYAGVGGSLGALAVGVVTPDSFAPLLSILLFVGLVAGGSASLFGAVLGAGFIVFVPLLAQGLSQAAPGAAYGAILILMLYLLPAGLAGLVSGRLAKWKI